MSKERIYFSPPYISDTEMAAVMDTLRQGWIAPVGPQLDQFEESLSQKFQYPNVLALNSGTAALHLAVRLAGVGAGDRVIVGSFTFVAAANAVSYERGVPVFMDSERDTWNLDPGLLNDYLKATQGKASFPKAVIVTHLFGQPAKIEEIAEICAQYEVKLIEDAAEALGTTSSGGRFVGGVGDFAALSFNGNKIITTGGGGALICKNAADHQRAQSLASQAKMPANHYLHEEMGFNYRLSNVLAGLGLAQLGRFDEIMERKKARFQRYHQALKGLPWLTPKEVSGANGWVYPCVMDHEIGVDELIRRFEAANIEARRFWRPLHMQPLFSGAEYVGGSVAEDLFRKGICLPSGAGLTFQEMSRVIGVLEKV
ncbi:MAG: aminotransferase class I/II-fold pyridoxal phosphate-dependent enzyme [Marinoscillum sp.]|uniref:DegT/DnrJ/EryC1/StrS family aminotransferase n=1 Tax=Marinoscillum sp. TaxID=2024838 RepID=UPI0032FAABD2